MTTDITTIGMIVGLMLMAVPLYAFHRLGAKMITSTMTATVRMVVQLFLIGLYLRYLFEYNSSLVNILWVGVMVIVAAFTAAHRTGIKRQLIVMPLCVGLMASAMAVGMYFLVLVLRLANPFDARYFVPIMGILMGNMLGVNVMALNTYYDSMHREQSLYYYLLGNGATHFEAVRPFVSRAIEKAFAPCVANMAVMGIVSLPGTMIGQLLGGSLPGIAIKYQIMIIVITFTASMLSLVITLIIADRRSFDSFGRIIDVMRRK